MSSESSSKFSAETYFETQPPPSSLHDDISKVREYVRKQRDLGRKVVLITVSNVHLESKFVQMSFDSVFIKSGGTTVPLELNV